MQGGSWSRIPRPSEPRQLMLPLTWWFCQAGESMMPSAEVRRAVFFSEGGLCMPLRVQCRGNLPNTLCALAIGGVFLTVAGCSSHEPKPMAQPTPDQVRGHADHTFDKLKQEERERTSQEPR